MNNLKIQVLVATMNQSDHSLIEKMNIRTDAIVGNQCDCNSVEEFEWRGNHIKYLNFAERGVGLNRNNALMRASADICLFADDDMVYDDNYAGIIQKGFEENPRADVIIFRLRKKTPSRIVMTKKKKVWYLNYMRYGTAQVAIRLQSVKKHGIFFNQCFGGGAEYCHGEDTLFLHSCLHNRLKIIALPEYIATLTGERESTWNRGYDEKYLRDQGILYHIISRKWGNLLCLQDAIRRRKRYKMKWTEAYRLMTSGDNL